MKKRNTKRSDVVRIEIPRKLWNATKRTLKCKSRENVYAEIIYVLTDNVLAFEESDGKMSRLDECDVKRWLKKLGVDRIIYFSWF